MSDDFDPETSPLIEVDKEIARRTGWLIESNAEMINGSREQARSMLDLAEKYREMAEECEEIAKLHAIGARRVADFNGDLISAEWGITVLDDDGDDEEEDEDDE